MKAIQIARINGVDIYASEKSEQLVPIRPICDALGVSFTGQRAKLTEHPVFSSVVALEPTTGTDGKTYEMLCLPMLYFPGWLFTINPANVKEESRKALMEFQLKCHIILFNYFFGNIGRENKINCREMELVEMQKQVQIEKRSLNKREKEINTELTKIREERLKDEPDLFS